MGRVRIDCIGLGQDREMGKVGGKRPLSRPRRKWGDIIQIDIQEVGCRRLNCIGLGHDLEMETLGGKKSLRRPRRKWDDSIGIDFQEVGCGRMDLSVWVMLGKLGNLEERDH